MKPARLIPASLLLLGLTAMTAGAEPVAYRIDPSHSTASFSIRHIFSKVPGRFRELEGTIQYDEQNLGNSSADITIKTSSIDTNHERRDNDLRSKNFFHADSFATITFKSTKVIPVDKDHFKLVGDLNMHGVSKPVTLDVTYLGSGPFGMGGKSMGKKAGWEATTTINRKEWGITWNQTLDQGGTLLGDDVAITIGIEAGWRPPATADAKPASEASPAQPTKK
ncbi:MAG TPA: YceI family protein [Candidatus Eisenbacteria bacterium]|nr:YceI family protein [Candidatus Eisenbacteria bacterium]